MDKLELILDTGGHCFFCLKPPPTLTVITADLQTEIEEDGNGDGQQVPPFTVVTFLKLCQYLDLNVKQVVGDLGVIIRSFSTLDAKQLELKGSLCKECRPINDAITDYILQMERIELKLQNCFKTVHDKMRREEGKISGLEEVLPQFPIVQSIWRKTFEQCKLKKLWKESLIS